MTRGIRVKNTDDIQKINKIVTKYGFDIWIHRQERYGRRQEPARHVPAQPERAASDRSGRQHEDPAAVKALFKDLAQYLEIDDED